MATKITSPISWSVAPAFVAHATCASMHHGHCVMWAMPSATSSLVLRGRAPAGSARRQGVERAAAAGWAVLAAGGHALDAVIAAVGVLEDDPHFNAGLGSVLTVEGVVEMDASVMAGDTLAAGAVGAVTGVWSPVRLARAVLVEGREVLLVGEPAEQLARRHGL